MIPLKKEAIIVVYSLSFIRSTNPFRDEQCDQSSRRSAKPVQYHFLVVMENQENSRLPYERGMLPTSGSVDKLV